jgi:hypothetical protein
MCLLIEDLFLRFEVFTNKSLVLILQTSQFGVILSFVKITSNCIHTANINISFNATGQITVAREVHRSNTLNGQDPVVVELLVSGVNRQRPETRHH